MLDLFIYQTEIQNSLTDCKNYHRRLGPKRTPKCHTKAEDFKSSGIWDTATALGPDTATAPGPDPETQQGLVDKAES